MRPSTNFYALWLQSKKLLKKQKHFYGLSYIVKTAETCKKWEPNNELVKAIKDGTVERQYTDTVRKLKEKKKTTLYKVVDTEDK